MMATKMTSAEWWDYLGDGARKYTREELADVERLILRELVSKQIEIAAEQLAVGRQQVALTEQAKHHLARVDGRLERLEFYLWRKDQDYPLAQRDEADYRTFRRAVKEANDAKAAILNGTRDEDDD